MTTCPICQKTVDPLRARSVGVRDGKVVAFCSAECASKAGAAAASPGPRVPRAAEDLDSGPVIEIVHEPASGVVTSAPDRRDTPPTGHAIARPSSSPAVEAKTSKPSSGSTTEIDPREILGADDEADETAGDGEPAAPTRSRRESHNVKLAEDWLEDEPAEPQRPPTASVISDVPKKSRGLLVFVVLLLLGGGGWLLYQYVYLPRVAASGARQHEPSGEVVPGSAERVEVPVAPPAPEPGEILARATTVLHGYLATEHSPRVQRAAAMALARSRDDKAIERLVAALSERELDVVGKIDVAYALGRAGEARGTEFLAGKLRVTSRDDRLGAARRLAQLGDKRAVPVLVTFLGLAQHQLGAAEALARLSEPRALEVLERTHADAKATADDRAAAAVALGLAGKREVAPELRALLTDRGFNAFAAEALAELGDEAARPVLEGQLEVSQLRVRAARSLRRLAPDREVGSYLVRLVAMLDDPAKQRDIDQLQTAEAILLLAGNASWADHP
jgi:HEAT repeat protein